MDELKELKISELKQLMEKGSLSSLELVDYYIDRIERIDRNGPALNSVLELNPHARDIARQIDNEKIKGPLAGIPILIKGNIDTGDSMETTAGSLALIGNHPTEDAEIVKRLREAGAVILGKTNLSEWANFRSTHSSSGWSSVGGQTRNPYILDRTPCGSSSGSGTAVSANLCTVAIGTETDGSIICPSSINGIVGIKPTVGAVSQKGIIPISHSQDTAGPMARTVDDAALVLSVLTGNKELLDTESSDLSGVRIGVVRNYWGKVQPVDDIMNNALDSLKETGAVLIDTPLETKDKFDDSEFEILLYEFKDGLDRYLSNCHVESGVKSISDLMAYNKSNREKIMPWFGQEILEMANKKGSLQDKNYRTALKNAGNLSRTKGIDQVMDKNKLHALVSPSGGPAWKTDWINGDHFSIGSSSPAAVSGYPNMTVPAGFIHNLPVGISFWGMPHRESGLIKIASVYERNSGMRRPPEFLKS